MKILGIISGEYGERHMENITRHAPASWQVEAWQAPHILPPIIDYPEDYLPETLPVADLLLSFAEHRGVAELLPEIAEMTGAKALIAAIDNEAWLPRGLARQLVGWLERMNIACATPKPLCSLTEFDYGVTRRERIAYKSAEISEFASYFGKPDLKVEVNPSAKTITKVEVKRDAVCGCARHVAEGLVGLHVDEAEEKAGLLHHHFPCLASMTKLPEFNHDTLMHESGHLIVENIEEEIKAFKTVRYISPGKRSES